MPAPSERTIAKTVHVFVALCDNASQGIVPVPRRLGDGTDPANNLYWGARYGVHTFLAKSADWALQRSGEKPSHPVLERVVFSGTSRRAAGWWPTPIAARRSERPSGSSSLLPPETISRHSPWVGHSSGCTAMPTSLSM